MWTERVIKIRGAKVSHFKGLEKIKPAFSFMRRKLMTCNTPSVAVSFEKTTYKRKPEWLVEATQIDAVAIGTAPTFLMKIPPLRKSAFLLSVCVY
jgi:hypothetical protein